MWTERARLEAKRGDDWDDEEVEAEASTQEHRENRKQINHHDSIE